MTKKFHISKFLQSDYFFHFLNAFFLKGFAFLLLPFYSHMLSIEQFGYYDVIITTSTLSDILFSLGLVQYFFIDFLHHPDAGSQKKLTDRITSQYLVLGGALYAFFVLFNIRFEGAFGIALPFYYLSLALLTSFINFFQNMLLTALRLRMESKRLLFIQVSISALNAFSIISLLVFFKKDIISILLPGLIVALFAFFICIRTYRRIFQSDFSFNFKWSDSVQILKLALPFVPNQLSFWAINNLNRFFLVSFTSAAEVGVYGMASKFGNLFEPLFIQPFINAYTPKSLKSMQEGSKFAVPFRSLAGLGVLFIVCSIAMKYLLHFVIEGDYAAGLSLLPLFALSSFVFLMVQVYNIPLIHRKMVKELLWGVALGGIVTVLLNILLVPIFKSLGSVLGSLGGNLAWLLCSFYYSRKASTKNATSA